MNRQEIQKLLGGFATGTLTPEEQQALFAAALEDQELFDALGREQALHDLLRDPAAKAQLLAALDAPAAERFGFWSWLRRPLVTGFAAAGVTAIAVLAVWQGTRGKPLAPAPVTMAELRAPDRKLPEPAAPEAQVVKPQAPPVRRAESVRRLEKDAVSTLRAPASAGLPEAPAAPIPAPTAPAAPRSGVVGGVPSQAVEVTAQAVQMDAVQEKSQAKSAPKLVEDARSLFYGNAFNAPANAVAPQLAAGSGGAQSSTQPMAAPAMRAVGNVAKKEKAAPNLGVRISLLRGTEEIAINTVLNAGENVRLKLTPNEDGFLYVAAREGTQWKMVASGPVQRLKPFETPALPYTGSGPKQLYVMLSRQGQTLSPEALAGLARNNLVESLADQDRATYVVSGLAAEPQQVVQAITLTYR